MKKPIISIDFNEMIDNECCLLSKEDIKTDIEVYSINIYNVIGKKVQVETNTSFSIRTLNQGIYFVEVITAEGTMNSQIVKK